MGYDSYVQLPEGKHMENLEGHKHSVASTRPHTEPFASELQHVGLAHGLCLVVAYSLFPNWWILPNWGKPDFGAPSHKVMLQKRSSFVAGASIQFASVFWSWEQSELGFPGSSDVEKSPTLVIENRHFAWNDVAPRIQYHTYFGFPRCTLVRASCWSFRIYSVFCLCSKINRLEQWQECTHWGSQRLARRLPLVLTLFLHGIQVKVYILAAK